MKIARYATGRSAVVSFDHGFHGRTLMGMTLTGKAMPYKHGFGPFAPEVYKAPYSYPFSETGKLDDTITVPTVDHRCRQHRVCGGEPIAGEGGFIVPEPGWLTGLYEWCQANGIMFVADEVQTASVAQAHGLRASTKTSCPISSPPRRASEGDCPSVESPVVRRSWTRCIREVSVGHSAAIHSHASRRWRPSR